MEGGGAETGREHFKMTKEGRKTKKRGRGAVGVKTAWTIKPVEVISAFLSAHKDKKEALSY